MAFFRPEKRPEGCVQPHDLSCENGVWGRFSPTSKAPLDNQRHCLRLLSASLKWAFFRVIVWTRGEFV